MTSLVHHLKWIKNISGFSAMIMRTVTMHIGSNAISNYASTSQYKHHIPPSLANGRSLSLHNFEESYFYWMQFFSATNKKDYKKSTVTHTYCACTGAASKTLTSTLYVYAGESVPMPKSMAFQSRPSRGSPRGERRLGFPKEGKWSNLL